MNNNVKMPDRVLACPVCGGEMFLNNSERYCAAGHRFDVAKEGYTNLLLSNKSKLAAHGDNRDMVAARDTFLSSGAYSPLCNALCESVAEAVSGKPDAAVIDAGCGECSYTALMAGVVPHMYGFDISKDAIRKGAKKCRAMGASNASLYVASVFDLPAKDASADAIVSVFAPLAEEEFLRVLADDGRLIRAVPGKRHLYGLKRLMYDNPYENSDEERVSEAFELVSEKRIDYILRLDRKELICALIKMTPYFYRTSPADRARAESAESVETEISFRVLEYIKKK